MFHGDTKDATCRELVVMMGGGALAEDHVPWRTMC
jgi:hypothetical protein